MPVISTIGEILLISLKIYPKVETEMTEKKLDHRVLGIKKMATESKIIKEEIGINSEFGPIKEPVKLDILPLTVFIGPQGTGKSLISQLLYFFREVKYLLARLPDRKNANHAVRKMVDGVRAGEQTHKAFAPFLTKNVHINYTRWYDTSSLERKLSFLNNNYQINPLDSFKTEIETWLQQFVDPNIAGQVLNQALFIPAERTFFSHVINPSPHLLGDQALSRATREFISFLFTEAANTHLYWQQKPASRPKEVNEIDKLVKEALGGQALCVQNGTYAKKWQFILNESTQPLEMASSGQMDTWPLVSATQAIFGMEHRPLFLHIEEPEAHLHPYAQIAVMKMLAYLVNQGFHLVITTHSLFVLYALNNLTMAHQKLGYQKVKNMPKPHIRIAPSKMGAYLFAEGSVKNIIDKPGHINESLLEQVLGDLEVEYNKLLTYKVLWG
jgi:predicted ATPase